MCRCVRPALTQCATGPRTGSQKTRHQTSHSPQAIRPRPTVRLMGDGLDEEAVRLTAYFLWEQEGYPEGKAQDFWYRAYEQHRLAKWCQQELEQAPPKEDE
jgi:hypothetical protein